jgi:beta-alanine--pyruvate transaminase
MLGGVDIDPAIVGMDGYAFQKRLYDLGLHIKSTGNSLIFAPPFTCSEAEIDTMIDITRHALLAPASTEVVSAVEVESRV